MARQHCGFESELELENVGRELATRGPQKPKAPRRASDARAPTRATGDLCARVGARSSGRPLECLGRDGARGADSLKWAEAAPSSGLAQVAPRAHGRSTGAQSETRS